MKTFAKTLKAAALTLALSFAVSTAADAATITYADHNAPLGGTFSGAPFDTGAGMDGYLTPIFGAPLLPYASFEVQVDRAFQPDASVADSDVDGNFWSFTDTWTFDVLTDSVILFTPDVQSIGDLVFSFNGGGDVVLTERDGTQTQNPFSAMWANLNAGLNTLTVSGKVLSAAGGDYSVDVSAVPLPPAALAFGSALFGIGALRRRNKKAAA
jgi:hypothetical protein